MGNAPIAYVEGAGGIRVAEDQIVTVGNQFTNWHIDRVASDWHESGLVGSRCKRPQQRCWRCWSTPASASSARPAAAYTKQAGHGTRGGRDDGDNEIDDNEIYE
ncbi:hypothetical protein B0H65DRAFT_444174 [Neurospora tetraspora]|uniref:Uncharacterized protein n=1 Tax=Neurospora tetraspora TaxID=94610 RepID=A0AAE0J9Z5_9PEZI|nr:hypothetical protein B0H65DRAFT_444174 [Neurospora tetraspora]